MENAENRDGLGKQYSNEYNSLKNRIVVPDI
jgi:hypothetical protein